ncbi:MAG: cupin domain-containing protein [Psychromonas sp.]|nr:cupin domain-containing protein [Psychromonas sp.]
MSVVNIYSAEHYTWGKQCDGWHLVKSESLSVIQECMPAGSHESNHYHQHAEQFSYILSGVATMHLKNEMLVLNANEGIHVKAGIIHQLTNTGLTDLHFIVTSTPPSHGDKIEIS